MDRYCKHFLSDLCYIFIPISIFILY